MIIGVFVLMTLWINPRHKTEARSVNRSQESKE
jgi:hypothetical protein